MALEEANMTVDELFEVRDRSLVENYQPHDIAMAYLDGRLGALGFEAEEFGDDARHADTVFFGDGPDIKVIHEGEVIAHIEIKSKRLSTGAEWFGRLNRRHYNEYVEFSDSVTEPVFIWFALVDEPECRICRSGFIEVTGEEIDGTVTDLSEKHITFPASAIQTVEGAEDLRAVPADAIENVDSNDQVVDGIPSVKGNDVVCLDQDDFRSLEWFHWRVIDGDNDY